MVIARVLTNCSTKPPGRVAKQFLCNNHGGLLSDSSHSPFIVRGYVTKVDRPAMEDGHKPYNHTSHAVNGQRGPRVLITNNSLPHFQDKKLQTWKGTTRYCLAASRPHTSFPIEKALLLQRAAPTCLPPIFDGT